MGWAACECGGCVMTEEEAKTKACPQRPRRLRTTKHPRKETLRRCNCLASECMWWRWDDVPNPDYDQRPHFMATYPPLRVPMTIKSETDGYCGAAGRP